MFALLVELELIVCACMCVYMCAYMYMYVCEQLSSQLFYTKGKIIIYMYMHMYMYVYMYVKLNFVQAFLDFQTLLHSNII